MQKIVSVEDCGYKVECSANEHSGSMGSERVNIAILVKIICFIKFLAPWAAHKILSKM